MRDSHVLVRNFFITSQLKTFRHFIYVRLFYFLSPTRLLTSLREIVFGFIFYLHLNKWVFLFFSLSFNNEYYFSPWLLISIKRINIFIFRDIVRNTSFRISLSDASMSTCRDRLSMSEIGNRDARVSRNDDLHIATLSRPRSASYPRALVYAQLASCRNAFFNNPARICASVNPSVN